MYFIHHFVEGMKVARNIGDWDDARFGWGKAYASSVMSLSAYEHLSSYEIPDAPRAKLIPSDSYQHAMWQGHQAELAEKLASHEVEVLEVIDRPLISAVIARIGIVVFVALRGTQSLYDLMTDLKVLKVRLSPGSEVRLHRGFAGAVDSCIAAVCARLLRVSPGTPAVVTGHSLGGAMAAIMHARFHHRLALQGEVFRIAERYPISCYVFGMPRFGNISAVRELAPPFHVYNVADLVPTVPNRLFGYSDLAQIQEYCLGRGCRLLRPYLKGSGALRLRAASRKILGLGDHRMEGYVTRTQVAFHLGLAVD